MKHADKRQVVRAAAGILRRTLSSIRRFPGNPCAFSSETCLSSLHPGEFEDDTHCDPPDEDEIEILRGDRVQGVKCAGHFFLRHGLPPALHVVVSDWIPDFFEASNFSVPSLI